MTDIDGSVIPTYCVGNISYVVKDPRGAKLEDGNATLNKFGSFSFSFKLKDNVNLGTATVEIKYEGTTLKHHNFKIQEFRRPEFETSIVCSPISRHFCSVDIGGNVFAQTKANYYSGGPLSDANVNWKITAVESSFRPKGLFNYTFGKKKNI